MTPAGHVQLITCRFFLPILVSRPSPQLVIDCRLSSRARNPASNTGPALDGGSRRFHCTDPDCLAGLAGNSKLTELHIQGSGSYMTGVDSHMLVQSISHLSSLQVLHLEGMELSVHPLSQALAALTGV